MRFFFLGLSLGSALILSGCNTTPYDRSTIYYERGQFAAQLAKDLGVADTVLQHGRCSLIVSTPDSNTGTYYFCTYALTANRLYVQGWDAKTLKYVELVQLDLTNLKKMSLYTFLRTKQLQLTEERRQIALSASIDDGGYVDAEATERLFDAIKAKGVPVAESEGLITPPAAPVPMIIPIVMPKSYR
ncbi:hypothetical protein [Pseudomonas sp. S3_H09]